MAKQESESHSVTNMNKNNEAYRRFKDVLGSPKYIVAPMVEQSELAWRMLARKHGAQLCFTPMYSANTFVNDSSYKKKVLEDLSCKEDRPLIVQFCSNTSKNFVKASLAVQELCDGVDLNLGCPQHIARRGHFGAFLQDDWQLIKEIITSSREKLKICVSAKIRVFSDMHRTVEYAKMLESSGCHFITVHGRTREQKGPLTGKASWLHIKTVKQSINIPVFSNGNIQYTEDIHRCLEQTGVDGVMLAEGHLSNPFIFEGVQPKVSQVTNEYFDLVQAYPCPVSHIRTHLFRLWAHALLVHRDMREKFGQATTVQELISHNDELILRCQKDEESLEYGASCHWICQPYIRPNRLPEHNKEKVQANGIETSENKTLSKNAARRLLRYERKIEGKKLKRKKEHDRRKQRDREQLHMNEVQSERVLRRCEKKEAICKRMTEAMNGDVDTFTVCVDLSWSNSMNDKELNKLSGQLGRIYGSNRNATKPARLVFTSLDRNGRLWEECIRKHDGFTSFIIDMKSEAYNEVFDQTQIVYLTPDAEQALDTIQPSSVYVLGGLVDETVIKKLTLDGAQGRGIVTRRLPVQEHMERIEGRANYSTVYSINQVFDILLTFHSTGCWRSALKSGVPPRKGYKFVESVLQL